MLTIEHTIETLDLDSLYAGACLAGMILCAMAMSLIPPCSNAALHWIQRTSYLAIGLVLAWSFLYADEKGWQPWPPNLALVIVIDCITLARIVVRRTGFLESRI